MKLQIMIYGLLVFFLSGFVGNEHIEANKVDAKPISNKTNEMVNEHSIREVAVVDKKDDEGEGVKHATSDNKRQQDEKKIIEVPQYRKKFVDNKDLSSTSIVDKVSELELLKMVNDNWLNRKLKLDQLAKLNHSLSDQEKDVLIDVFKSEGQFVMNFMNDKISDGFTYTETQNAFDEEFRKNGYAEYYKQFTRLISTFKDPRAIEPLLIGSEYFGGEITAYNIIPIGEKGVQTLLDLYQSENELFRNSSLYVLSIWINSSDTTEDSEDYSIPRELFISNSEYRQKIKEIFIKGVSDDDVTIRSSSILGLSSFIENDAIEILEYVSKHDPYIYKSSGSGKIRYPMRESAMIKLEKMRMKGN